MLKKTITFKDLDGNEITEDFYFNLSKRELAEMKIAHKGDLSEYLKEIIRSEDGQAILDNIKNFIAMSVGVRGEDGRRFIKNRDITDSFMQSDAYDELFFELVSNADAAADFFMGIVPEDIRNHVANQPSDEDYTDEQLLAMSDEEYERVVGDDPRSMSQRQILISMQRKNRGNTTHKGRPRKKTVKR